EAETLLPAGDPTTLHERAIELRPSYAAEYYWWGQSLASEGRTAEASDALDKARRLDPAGKVAPQ
ncbi:MAG: hypothetical protein PVH90_10415, partial [Gammaproteobacteria bacterium]